MLLGRATVQGARLMQQVVCMRVSTSVCVCVCVHQCRLCVPQELGGKRVLCAWTGRRWVACRWVVQAPLCYAAGQLCGIRHFDRLIYYLALSLGPWND